MTKPVLLVVGVGRGLGAAIAARYAAAGYDLALIARSEATLTAIGEELSVGGGKVTWAPVDITDEAAFVTTVRRIGVTLGRIDALHFNPSAFTQKDALALSQRELLLDLRLGVTSLLPAVQAARGFMPRGARISATGGATADQPWGAAASLGVQKAALRNLVAALDLALIRDDIRAMVLTVAGTMAPGTPFDPTLVADALYVAASAPNEHWQREVTFRG